MKRTYIRLLVLLTIIVIAPLSFAKGLTLKIMIRGADLAKPIEITDSNVLAAFNILTSSNEHKGLIIDWSQGVVSERPKGL